MAIRLQRRFKESSFWLRLLLHRREAEQALNDEIQFHLDAATEQNLAKGMTQEAARRAARIELGGVEQVKEKIRAARTGASLETFVQDLRFGLRMLRKSPGFTIVAVLILALGIGANTAIFSIINGLMLRNLPVRDPGRLVELLHQYPGEPAFNSFSWDAYQILRDGSHAFSDLIVGPTMNFGPVRVDTLQPHTVFVGSVGGNFFQALGVRAAKGRLIGPEDVRIGYHAPVAVVSWSFWKSRFDLDPGIIGKKIVVGDDAPLTIIGVTQRGFYGLSEQAKQDVWWPVSLGPSQEWGFPLLGRLKPGISIEQARAEMAVLFQRVVNLPDAGPFVKKMKFRIEPAGHGVSTPLRAMLSTPLVVLMGVVGLLLVLACTNLAGLLLARAASRQHEMAVRACLGASRARLVRQTLTESLLLSMMGSVLGIFLAYFGTRGLIRIFASGRQIIGAPVHFDALSKPDWHVLLFTGAIAIMTALLFGAVPAIRACRPTSIQPQEPARAGESRSQRLFGKSLVVSQVALSLMLLTSAALFVGYLSQLRNLDLGFRRDHLLLITLDTAHSDYTAPQYGRLSEQLVARIDAIPGVTSATLSDMSPMQGPGAGASAFEPAHRDSMHNILINNVGPSYFETYGTPLLSGRYFPAEVQDKPLVAILNQAAARDCFGSENPIGKHLTLSHITLTKGEITYEVVGVVADAKYNELQQPAPPTIYRDLVQAGSIGSQLAVRTRIAPDAVAGVVRGIESSVLKTVPIVRITTMNEQIDAAIVPERLVAALSGWFGALGALLAAVGLYGLLAYTVTRRTHEIGVRMALGATRSEVIRMVLHDALWTVCAGMALGAPLAFWANSMAASLIHGLPAKSPGAILFGGAVMIVLGMVAAYTPARKAMRVDPMVALRYE
ncbi:MAG TPA: ABC transporter permease [Terriglobales bacterium]|jgi:predicted permease|nr:ABC transporter permease [Terriglobales bacterium]